MTSSNGNIFRVTGPLFEEFTDHRWIPPWINSWVKNRNDGDLRRHRARYDVVIMHRHLQKAYAINNLPNQRTKSLLNHFVTQLIVNKMIVLFVSKLVYIFFRVKHKWKVQYRHARATMKQTQIAFYGVSIIFSWPLLCDILLSMFWWVGVLHTGWNDKTMRLNGTVEVWEWIYNFNQYFLINVNTYLCWD